MKSFDISQAVFGCAVYPGDGTLPDHKELLPSWKKCGAIPTEFRRTGMNGCACLRRMGMENLLPTVPAGLMKKRTMLMRK